MADLYKILGVSRSASADEVKRAYRKLAKEFHPDRHPGDSAAEERFKQIGQAYGILGDAEKRKRYDAGEIDDAGQERAHHGFHRRYAQQGDPFRNFEFGAGGAEDIFSDLFGNMGGRFRQGTQPPQRGADLRFKLKVGFIEAAQGSKKRIQLGGGKTLDVNIPAGTEDGDTLRLKGQGQEGAQGAPKGDALIEIAVEDHAFFKRDGKSLKIDLPITLQEAVNGGSVEVPTLSGKVSLKVPPGSSSGKVLRAKGKGIPGRKGQEPGDLYITLQIQLPETLDDSLRQAITAWSEKHPYNPRKKLVD